MNTHRAKAHLMGTSSDGLTVGRAEDCLIYDTHGNRYIDFTSGWCVGNFGWSDESIRRAIREFDGPAYVQPGHSYKAWQELASLLVELSPGQFTHCFRATGGTEAVEIALQVTMACTGRRKFVSIEGSYHGNSIATSSISASERRRAIENHLPNCFKVSPPLNERAIGRLDTLLKKKDIAAFIMEPIICNLGVLIPNQEFMAAAQRLCRRYGTLLVMDEVATGFGRTGALFATEHYDLEPDVLCLAKAITGGYAPMGATLVTEEVANTIKDLEIYSTYGWHPLSVAVALANLKSIRQHRAVLLKHTNKMSDIMKDRLSHIDFQDPVELRIQGLAIGIVLGHGKDASAIQNKCRRAGLLVFAEENRVSLFPSLTISETLLQEGIDILERCVARKQC
jgi:acetylornithine/N-succinyldiaminopimelate aminotransferase